MKRVAPWFFVFLFFLFTAACGAENPAEYGWNQQVKIPAAHEYPHIREAATVWAAEYATATAAAAMVTAQPPAAPTATPDPLEGIRAIHKVESGETLLGIANKWGCPAEVIQAANRGLVTNPDQISIGWELKIPSC